jgi:hypothetical protein
MATLAVPPRDPTVAATPSGIAPNQSIIDGIDAYLGAGDHMARMMDITGKICMALIALIALAWAIGVLPGAVRLFR